MDKLPLMAVVVPCYNEADVLAQTHAELESVLLALIADGRVEDQSFILFVDDGSEDETWEIIEKLAKPSGASRVRGLKLAGNAGHQNALFAGLMHVRHRCDCAVSLDADLQDDTTAIGEFLKKYAEGSHIVYGIRGLRNTDTPFKRGTAEGFYSLMKALGVKLRHNHADYRLMSRQALDALSQYGENHLFLRGIIPLLGFSSAAVYYSRGRRVAGATKYPLRKMISFALNGITSFSNAPIRMITYMGILMLVLSVAAIIYSLVSVAAGRAVSGWASVIISLWFIGGLQFIAIGVVGEYIGKVFMEVKRRPRYIIEKEI